ncbi:MAG: hypothetical protein LBD46_05325 [Endomicrobium sp.]|jgi:hypothetical protein|nr:hypothetical protein [Endomicrobium sp.]
MNKYFISFVIITPSVCFGYFSKIHKASHNIETDEGLAAISIELSGWLRSAQSVECNALTILYYQKLVNLEVN